MSLVGVLEEPWYNTHQEALDPYESSEQETPNPQDWAPQSQTRKSLGFRGLGLKGSRDPSTPSRALQELLLRGSWDLVSRVISTLIKVISR